MATRVLPTTTGKKRRIMIITGDESIIEQIQHSEHSSLIKSYIIEQKDDDKELSHSPNETEIHVLHTKKVKNGTLTCVVCGSVALGYNFDAITCESCKAFFRRNALKDSPTFQCRRTGGCEITIESRKRCSACRLAKCLRMGMRRDRLLTAAEKAVKYRGIKQNQTLTTQHYVDTDSEESPLLSSEFLDQLSLLEEINLPSPTNVTDLSSLTLSPLRRALLNPEDSQRVDSIRVSYKQRIELAARDGLPWNPSMQATTSLQYMNSSSVSAMRLLTFFKQIPEFNELNVDDKIILIKYNLFPLFTLNNTLSFNTTTCQVKEAESDFPWHINMIEKVHGTEVFEQGKKIFKSFLRIAQYDERIIQLALLVLLFSTRFSTDSDAKKPTFNNGFAVNCAQNYYTELLWRYMESVHGSEKSTYIFNELVADFISWQTLDKELRLSIHRFLTTVDQNELLPIMKSLLDVT